MKLIAVSDIAIPDTRIRREFDEEQLKELADDIMKPHGLLHPLVLRDDGKTLVSGERRLRAIQRLYDQGKKYTHGGETVPEGQVPYQTLGDLSGVELLEAELSENVVRRDLTWQEKVQAYADIADLRELLNPEQTAVDTAREILGREPQRGEPTTVVSDSQFLVDFLEDPDVKKAKSQKEAVKMASRKVEREFTELLAEQYKTSPEDTRHLLLKGRLEDHMRELARESVDLILCDPPYGIDADTRFGDMAELDHEYSDSPKEALQRYEFIITEGFRVCKEKAHMYLFLDALWFSTLYNIASKMGWWVYKAPIVWDKGNGMLAYPEHMPRHNYEPILFAIKGKRESTAVYSDIIRVPNIKHKIHAAQKPVELFAQLIRRSCQPGDVVLDPCCGSGTVFPAANLTNTSAIGIELGESAYDTAYNRQNAKGDDD